MSHETILIVTTTFILPTIKFPQGLLKDHSWKREQYQNMCVCVLWKMLRGTGGNKEAKGDYNDAYRNVVDSSYQFI